MGSLSTADSLSSIEGDLQYVFASLPSTTTSDKAEEVGFTWRSVAIGTVIGTILAAQNIYFGLRNGMSFGDGIVAAIVGFGIMKTLRRIFPSMASFGLHEHVILQTAAAANISIIFSGGFSQYILAMTPEVQAANALGSSSDTWVPTYGASVAWLVCTGYLGFFVSQPYRTKLIVEQDLPWPGPVATARVLQALHHHNENDSNEDSVSSLSIAGVIAFMWQWLKWVFDGAATMASIPVFGKTLARYTIVADFSPAYVAGGMLTTFNAVYSMALGGIYGYLILFPIAESYRGIDGWYESSAVGIQGVKAYWFLPSLAMLVTDSLYQSVKITASLVSEFLNSTSSPSKNVEHEPPSRLVPNSFWTISFAINLVLVLVVVPYIFPTVQWYLLLPAILLALPLGYGICLGGALTGTFLISAVGKVLLLILSPFATSVVGALWLSGAGIVTVGSTEQVLVDYQVAHVTRTSPRQMFKAQIVAATVGFFITPLTYSIFIQAFPITASGTFTAPGGVALRALAVLGVNDATSSSSTSMLPGNVVPYFIIPSVVLALVLSIARDLFKENKACMRYIPNTMAFAIGFFINGAFPLNNVIGAIVKAVWKKYRPESEARVGAIVAGGMILGEGIAAITQAVASMCNVVSPVSIQF